MSAKMMLLVLNFSHFIKISLCSLIILGLSACTSIALTSSSYDFYQLQAIPLALQHKVFLESLTFIQPERRQLLTQIEINETTLSLAAMTYSGLAIMQAKWHGEKGLLNFSSQVFDQGMLLRIIQDIQLVKWPEHAIEAGLLNDHQLRTREQGVKRWREITQADQVVVSIVYIHNKVTLTNFIENYELVIENVNE